MYGTLFEQVFCVNFVYLMLLTKQNYENYVLNDGKKKGVQQI